MKAKLFGKHVSAFEGRENGGPLKCFVGCRVEDEDLLEWPAHGEWLTPTEARRLAKNLLKAADYVEAHEAKAKGVREVVE